MGKILDYYKRIWYIYTLRSKGSAYLKEVRSDRISWFALMINMLLIIGAGLAPLTVLVLKVGLTPGVIKYDFVFDCSVMYSIFDFAGLVSFILIYAYVLYGLWVYENDKYHVEKMKPKQVINVFLIYFYPIAKVTQILFANLISVFYGFVYPGIIGTVLFVFTLQLSKTAWGTLKGHYYNLLSQILVLIVPIIASSLTIGMFCFILTVGGVV